MIEIIEKARFSVIGIMGEGLAAEAVNWIPPLWSEANNRFAEIVHLAKRDHDGNLVAIWGAMSDVDDKFVGWQAAGKYLAGCEVVDDAVPPIGWTKWVVPAFKFAVSSCTQASYQDTLQQMLTTDLPQNDYQVVGAIQECYDPKAANGELFLYFPIEKLVP